VLIIKYIYVNSTNAMCKKLEPTVVVEWLTCRTPNLRLAGREISNIFFYNKGKEREVIELLVQESVMVANLTKWLHIYNARTYFSR
jgi:hypothetical protein